MQKKEKVGFEIVKTYKYAYHPELAQTPLKTSDLYSLADADYSTIKDFGLFLLGEEVAVKDLEK